jgi:hypothetical protein
MEYMKTVLDSLSENEKEAIRFCEEKGNGPYFYQIHKLLEKGIMEFTVVPKLMNIKAPRLSKFGLLVRDLLDYQNESKSIKDLYYKAVIFHTIRYKKMLEDFYKDKSSPSLLFCDEIIKACEDKIPLCKVNRWFGYIQRVVIALRLSTVEYERDITRSYFRPLDFSSLFYDDLF